MSNDEPHPAGPRVRTVPDGDDRLRLTCPDCGYIAYENPRVVVGAVCHYGDRILLCRRAIPPRLGYWTMPAGYLELNESTEEGARREAWEEARARIELGPVLGVYSVAHINQVHIIYRAELLSDDVAPGPESEAVAFYHWQDIPWDALAFPTVRWALEHARAGRSREVIAAAGAPRTP
ncbi:MAG TPA: NUDIX hydrolase [Gammaproteobacteria bacterium]|nr:NUDIX hydrolase [Gammaproteobacteria bacterium]